METLQFSSLLSGWAPYSLHSPQSKKVNIVGPIRMGRMSYMQYACKYRRGVQGQPMGATGSNKLAIHG